MLFIDLAAQQARIKDEIDAGISRVLDHGKYILGPEVAELEGQLAEFCGAKHCITCANGTDALVLALMALGIGPGDAVIVPAFTFAASAEAPCLVGATPIFADIDPDTFNVDPDSLRRCIDHAIKAGLKPKAIMTVDLFGLPANYSLISKIATSYDLKLICDSAQGWGGKVHEQMTGSFGDITTTSFFPAKPLGCYGDGGALFTNDDDLASLLKGLRVHGKGTDKYDNVRIGTNSRLDTLQAAILLEKLAIYADEIKIREKVAQRYTNAFSQYIKTPSVPLGYRSIWAQYTLAAKDEQERSKLMAGLKANNIPSVVYYPKSLPDLAAFKNYPCDPQGIENSRNASNRVFSLPMSPYLKEEDQAKVIDVLLAEFR